MRNPLSVLLLYLVLTSVGLAQSEAGAIFLLIPPSPTMNGMGEIGVCLPSDDIYAGYYNPANGMAAYSGSSLALSNMQTGWLEALTSNLTLEYSVAGLGILPATSPLQIVISHHKTYLDLGYQIRTGEQGEFLGKSHTYMKANSYLLALSFAGKLGIIPIDLAMGIARKTVKQNLGLIGIGPGQATSTNKMYDYGLLISAPFQLRGIPDKFNQYSISIKPAIGYSVSNIGDYISFFDPAQADPTPRYLRLGLSISTAVTMESGWNIITWKGGRAAGDILIDLSDPDNTPYPYQSGLGDIDIVKHIVNSTPEAGVEINRGEEISYFDLVTIRSGRRIDIQGKVNLKEWGSGLHLKGFLYFLDYLTGSNNHWKIANYLDINYNYSVWYQSEYGALDGTTFESYTLTIKHIDQLLGYIIEQDLWR